MKKPLLICGALLLAILAMAQQPVPNPFPKTITVSGSAEMEIVPDEIYVNIELQEYQKKGESKKDLETIKTQFLESCKTAGIADSAISIVSYSGYTTWRKKKNNDLLATITYQVKFRSSKLMDDLVERLDDQATRNFLISSVSHSKITEFRKQVKIRAVQAAKDKGIYLTEAIGEKLGEAITINEPAEWPPIYYENTFANALVNNAVAPAPADQSNTPEEVDFRKIKLKYDVTIIFALR